MAKDTRQIPVDKCYTAQKDYNDLLWGLLQKISYMENGYRYVDKDEMNFSSLGERIGASRQTISKKVGFLIDNEMIEYELENGRYKIHNLESNLASLIPMKTLDILLSALNESSISLYGVLVKNWYRNNETSFRITMKQMKNCLGIATSTTSNNNKIVNILTVLKKLELIDFELKWESKDKCYYVITKVSLEILC